MRVYSIDKYIQAHFSRTDYRKAFLRKQRFSGITAVIILDQSLLLPE